ncbi:MAG: sialidase family protein [Acidobacteriota bacterium]|nr:sialidase family protein [Acidobacteriota bacterium]
MKSRRDFLKHGAAVMAILPGARLPKAMASEGNRVAAIAASSGAPQSAPPVPPIIEEIEGSMGPVVQLPDGRFLAVYPWGRRTKEWDDTSIPEYIYGRFSPDGLGGWGERQVLFPFPPGPGAAGQGITSGGALPLVTREGVVHLFGVRFTDWPKGPNPKASEVVKGHCHLWHTTSHDNARTWEPLREIDYGHTYTGALNSSIELKSGRILVALSYHSPTRATGFFVSYVVYSDDAGNTWKNCRSDVTVDCGGKAGESGACEPVLMELEDGRVWMIIRTQTGFLFESFSADGGETWSPARRTIFRASNAPAGVLRLRDGRLVLAWNNEFGIPFRDGISYSRQSLVMAIHDGGIWKGYRELNTFGAGDNLDGYGGMRYPFLAETPDHHVLVAYSEDGRASRKKQQFRAFVDYRLVRVDPRWLLETEAREDFSQGLQRLQLAATSGTEILPGPEGKPALKITKPRADMPSGFCWNFPFGRKGSVKIRLRTEAGFGGVYFALAEAFLTPSNNAGGNFRGMIDADGKVKVQYVCGLPYEDSSTVQWGVDENRKFQLEQGKIHELLLEWNCDDNVGGIKLDGHYTMNLAGLELARGICYLRLFSAATSTDTNGLWVFSLESRSEP